MIFARTAMFGLALAFAPAGPTAPTEPAPTEPAPAEPAPAEPSKLGEPKPDTTAPSDDAGPLAVDIVLPSGLRLIAAQDKSLPVAAVVLAVETGTEDDPADQPGLVHALAYQLLQGNRELAPHGVAQIVHDGGGVTALAIGPAQIRYESLVPASLLDDVIWAESQRLRAPTVSEPLWRDTLRWARRDRGRDWIVPAVAHAAIHQVDGLAHDGHHTPPELDALGTRAISTALAERFTVERATLDRRVADEPGPGAQPRAAAVRGPPRDTAARSRSHDGRALGCGPARAEDQRRRWGARLAAARRLRRARGCRRGVPRDPDASAGSATSRAGRSSSARSIRIHAAACSSSRPAASTIPSRSSAHGSIDCGPPTSP